MQITRDGEPNNIVKLEFVAGLRVKCGNCGLEGTTEFGDVFVQQGHCNDDITQVKCPNCLKWIEVF